MSFAWILLGFCHGKEFTLRLVDLIGAPAAHVRLPVEFSILDSIPDEWEPEDFDEICPDFAESGEMSLDSGLVFAAVPLT